jgi:hypothetical protein
MALGSLGTKVPHGLGEFISPGVSSNMHNAAQDILDIYKGGGGALNPIFDQSRGGFDFSPRWGVNGPGQPPMITPRIVYPAHQYASIDETPPGAMQYA